MPAARVICCERQGRFGPLLRRALAKESPELGDLVVETRILVHCERALDQAPASLVLLEVTKAGMGPALEFLVRAGVAMPASRFAALFPPDSGPDSEFREPDHVLASAAFREAGAIAVYYSAADVPRLVRLARRHLALSPPEDLSFRDSVWKRLPWKARAQAH